MATMEDSANWASHQAYPSDKSMTYAEMENQARLRIAFQKGARWKERRIMEEGVQGTMDKDGFLVLSNGDALDFSPRLGKIAFDLQPGDKVRIIVMKEEE